MAKAVIMLAMLKQVINSPKLEKDCLSFDKDDNLKAGRRIRATLRKLRPMIKGMISDTLAQDDKIRLKRWPTYKKIRSKKYAEKDNT